MRRRLRVGPRPDPEEKRQPNHRATALPAPTTDDSAGQQGSMAGSLSHWHRYTHLKLVPVCTPRLRTLYPLSTISLTSGRPFLEPTANLWSPVATFVMSSVLQAEGLNSNNMVMC